jgi:hypothetical protein
MDKKYQLDEHCLELFTIAAKYSENVGVNFLTARLEKLADEGKAISKNGGTVINLTHEEIYEELKEARNNRPATDDKKILKLILVSGGIGVSLISVISFLIVGNVASIPFIWGSGGLTLTGGIIATAAIKLINIDVQIPGSIKVKLQTYNEDYGRPFPPDKIK